MLPYLQVFVDICAKVTLPPGCSKAMTERSSDTRASLLLPSVGVLQCLLWGCIGLARTSSELFPVSDSSYLMLLHSHSPFKGVRAVSPTTPAPSIIILHNHSPNKSLAHPVLSSASQRTLLDTGHRTNSYKIRGYCTGITLWILTLILQKVLILILIIITNIIYHSLSVYHELGIMPRLACIISFGFIPTL